MLNAQLSILLMQQRKPLPSSSPTFARPAAHKHTHIDTLTNIHTCHSHFLPIHALLLYKHVNRPLALGFKCPSERLIVTAQLIAPASSSHPRSCLKEGGARRCWGLVARVFYHVVGSAARQSMGDDDRAAVQDDALL